MNQEQKQTEKQKPSWKIQPGEPRINPEWNYDHFCEWERHYHAFIYRAESVPPEHFKRTAPTVLTSRKKHQARWIQYFLLELARYPERYVGRERYSHRPPEVMVAIMNTAHELLCRIFAADEQLTMIQWPYLELMQLLHAWPTDEIRDWCEQFVAPRLVAPVAKPKRSHHKKK